MSSSQGWSPKDLCREVLETHVPEHRPILSQTLWNELVDTLRDKFQLSIDDLPVLHLYRRHAAWCDARTPGLTRLPRPRR